ncbi:MAG: serine protease [candidate division KSB1 bacterium]|nr:serine protease [candidate division KSB1 bacterium]
MKKLLSLYSAVPLILVLVLVSCAKKIFQTAYPTLSDGRYDSEFPYKSCSKELQEISESVNRVFCNSLYKSYSFSLEQKIIPTSITDRLLATASAVTDIKTTVSGTATVIYAQDNRLALLTCAHVVLKPDTLISYFAPDANSPEKFIQTVAIKQQNQILVAKMPEDGLFEVLLADEHADIAILGKKLKFPVAAGISVLNYPFGNARELEWGSFVYVIGYPMGYKLISKGIVSQPDRDKKGGFLTDVLFNPGLSGGILLAVRDGVPNFEVVGITTSAAAELETVLVPERGKNYDETVPYQGKIYVTSKKTISYGITKAISAESILELIRENREYLLKSGYDFEILIEPRPIRM